MFIIIANCLVTSSYLKSCLFKTELKCFTKKTDKWEIVTAIGSCRTLVSKIFSYEQINKLELASH